MRLTVLAFVTIILAAACSNDPAYCTDDGIDSRHEGQWSATAHRTSGTCASIDPATVVYPGGAPLGPPRWVAWLQFGCRYEGSAHFEHGEWRATQVADVTGEGDDWVTGTLDLTRTGEGECSSTYDVSLVRLD